MYNNNLPTFIQVQGDCSNEMIPLGDSETSFLLLLLLLLFINANHYCCIISGDDLFAGNYLNARYKNKNLEDLMIILVEI